MTGRERVLYFVYWDHIDRKSYLYGADLTIRRDRSVHFSNPMMPAGSILQEWDSVETDTIIRKEPELPLLTEGQHYRIHVYARADHEKTVLMRLNFFDRQRNRVAYEMVDEEEADIVCPPGAYRYSLQLINAGMGEFDFHCILISTAGERENIQAGEESAQSEDPESDGSERQEAGSRKMPVRGDAERNYCGRLLNPDDGGDMLTVIVPPYTRRMVRLPEEEELAHIRNCVIAPVTVLMPEPFSRKDWIRDVPHPGGKEYWQTINFVSYTRETDPYVEKLADGYTGGWPVYLGNEGKLAEFSS